MAGIPIAGEETLGIGHGPVKPAQAQRIGPHGNPHLIAAEESNRRANAMDCRPVTQVLLQIQTKPLLRPAADAENDVFGLPLLNSLQQFFVKNHRSVKRGEIHILVGNIDASLAQPANVALRAGSGRHHPEAVAELLEIRLFNQGSEVLEAGELGYAVAVDQVPEQDHKGAVGYGKVRAQQRFAIALVDG